MVGLDLKQVESHLSETLNNKVIIKSSSALGGGCINHASRINTNAGEFFLKWNSDCHSDLFIREAESLHELRKAAREFVRVPKVIAAKEVDHTPGYLVQEYLKPGTGALADEEKLGHGLATIHNFKNTEFGFFHDNYCGSTTQNNKWNSSWSDFFSNNRIRFLLDMIQENRPFPLSEMKIFERLVNRLPDLLPRRSNPVLIHGDLWSGNYMMTQKGPALIDPASYYADAEMEFGIITMFGGFSQRFYSAYNEINPLEKGWQERNPLFQLYHVLNHYYLFGGGYGSQAINIAKRYI